MKFFPNFLGTTADPGEWAQERETEGWPGVRASDHYWIMGAAQPHLWVTLTQMAMSTSRLEVGSSFANNLFRHPVEFAQAAMSLQRASQGRFEAGIGAGWNREEIERTGRAYPESKQRATMYAEAVTIVRELFDRRSCAFRGEFFSAEVELFDQASVPAPPLAVSVGGPRTTREVAPLADVVEIKASAKSVRSGGVQDGADLDLMAQVTIHDVREAVARAREANPGAPLGFFAVAAVGTNARVAARRAKLGDNLFGRMVGGVAEVADTLRGLEDLGITRVQITEAAPGTITSLAPELATLR